MIQKPEQHEIDRAGQRLLRDVVEPKPLGWVLNEVQEDYGIDYNLQVFDNGAATGAWFHVQLKSSNSTEYSADRSFISQKLTINHARHYAVEMREPVIVIHADVKSRRVFWYSPQLDVVLIRALSNSDSESITVRIPTSHDLPETAPALMISLDRLYLFLASRELASSPTHSFAATLSHFPNQDKLRIQFQEKNDALKLQKIRELYADRKLDEARRRARSIADDPDATVETRFWNEILLGGIDFTEAAHSASPQSKLPLAMLTHAKALQKLTKSGPNHLKFYALISRKAAELDILAHENFGLLMALRQHTEYRGNPLMIVNIYGRRSANTKLLAAKYRQCMRLVGYAANHPDRWVLGRAITNIVTAIGRYIVSVDSKNNPEAASALAQSALQICKLAAWIAMETGDGNALVMALISALTTTHSTDSDAYRWARDLALNIRNSELCADAKRMIERAEKRWNGEFVEGDIKGDVVLQAIENMASALGVDPSDYENPLVRALRIAAKDNSPERVLKNCEHLLVSQGSIGPNARLIQNTFNLGTAGSKMVHCTLHGFHHEGRELDVGYEEFKKLYCDACSDCCRRPIGWEYTEDVKREIEGQNAEFVRRLIGTKHGLRYVHTD